MKDTGKYIFSFLVALQFFIVLSAQGQTTAKAEVEKNRILIGEQFRLTLTVSIPANEPIRFFTVDSISHFEILQKEKIDTTNTGGGSFLSQKILLTSFDSGQHSIVPFLLFDGIATDSLTIDIVFSDFNSKQPYHAAKDIVEDAAVEQEKKTNSIPIIIAVSLVVAAFIIYLLLRKKTKSEPAPILPTPYEKAVLQWQQLDIHQPDAKLFYTMLVDIFRQYIFEKKGISSIQKTTDDLVIQLQTIGMSHTGFEKMTNALRLSDFVKFAKYKPEKEDNKIAYETIKESIDEIEQLSE